MELIVAPRLRPTYDGRNSSDGKTLEQFTYTKLVFIARLTLGTVGWGTIMMNWDTHSDGPILNEVIHCQLLDAVTTTVND